MANLLEDTWDYLKSLVNNSVQKDALEAQITVDKSTN